MRCIAAVLARPGPCGRLAVARVTWPGASSHIPVCHIHERAWTRRGFRLVTWETVAGDGTSQLRRPDLADRWRR